MQCVSGFVLVQTQFLAAWWAPRRLRAPRRDEKKKTLHLHYCILTRRLISAQGHQYIWHLAGWNKYRTNVPLLRSGSRASASINKQSICWLTRSVWWKWRPLPWGERRLSAFNIMNHKQYPIWTGELWKRAALTCEGRSRNQPAVWVMSESTGLQY